VSKLLTVLPLPLTQSSIGSTLGYCLNFYQEHLYRKNVATRGPEARLYGAMGGGVCFAVGCFIYAWTCEYLAEQNNGC
jgi:hypothetical protein